MEQSLWDPLNHPFPQTLHGFRCMLSLKYMSLIRDKYEPGTLGHELAVLLIQALRGKNYVRSNSRYEEVCALLEETTGSSAAKLHDRYRPVCGERCPACCSNLRAGSCEGKEADLSKEGRLDS
uniref:Protein V2 n=1 Tax=Sweet potato leaf curl Shandong virus 2 TaxID=2583405 RepID=A0A4P8YTH0_9GEMI|nr:AV2 [Sweet potato leaf curl Hubei virus]